MPPANVTDLRRIARWATAAPTPWPVDPIPSTRPARRSSSLIESSITTAAGWISKRSFASPVSSTSRNRTSTSRYAPAGTTAITPSIRMGVGRVRSTVRRPFSTTVCPEFGPPTRMAYRACCFRASQCVTLPLPSEPYWPPTTTLTGMTIAHRPSLATWIPARGRCRRSSPSNRPDPPAPVRSAPPHASRRGGRHLRSRPPWP